MRFEINGYKPPETKRWQAGKDTIEELFNNNRITFESGEPMLKYYKHEENNELSPFIVIFLKKRVEQLKVEKNY